MTERGPIKRVNVERTGQTPEGSRAVNGTRPTDVYRATDTVRGNHGEALYGKGEFPDRHHYPRKGTRPATQAEWLKD